MSKFISIFLIVIGFTTSALSWPVPDTGQNKCYDGPGAEIPCPPPGDPLAQDGTYIHQRSYTKLEYGGTELSDGSTKWLMVRDNVTGLIWEVKQNRNEITDYANPNDADNTYTWYDSNPETNGGNAGVQGDGINSFDTERFIQRLNDRQFGGFSDWRLPNIKELNSIVHIGNFDPAIDTAFFPHTTSPQWTGYWSATTMAGSIDSAWAQDFRTGDIAYMDSAKSFEFYARAVRSGNDEKQLNALIDNGDGTITDMATGLMWQQQATVSGGSGWNQALSYCENLILAGYDDWRLPNMKEILSIADCTPSDSAIDVYFHLPDPLIYSIYWTSSWTGDEWIWTKNIGGCSGGGGIRIGGYSRAVRSGQNRLPGHLKVVKPLQASKWNIDALMPIIWDPAGISGNVIISISPQGGRPGTFQTIAPSTPNDGSFQWTVALPYTFNAMLKIEPLSDPSKGAVQGLFSIVNSMSIEPLKRVISEPADEATFTIRLKKAPTADVLIDLTTTNPGEFTLVDGSSNRTNELTVRLDSSNWESGVDVKVRAEADNVPDGDQMSQVLTSTVRSDDPVFSGLNIPNISITVEDDQTGVYIDSVYPSYGSADQDLAVIVRGLGFKSLSMPNVSLIATGSSEIPISPVTVENSEILIFTIPAPGTATDYDLKVSYSDTEQDILRSAISFADATKIAVQRAKKAIIVAGGGPFMDNDLWPATRKNANKAFAALMGQGYNTDYIQYLSAGFDDITGDGESDVDEDATLTTLERAITDWPLSTSPAATDLLIYLMGPGRSGQFLLKSTEGYEMALSASTLEGWLDTIQSSLTGNLIVIMDSPGAGTFLAPLAAQDRMVITATSTDERAWFLFDGEISFSGIFWKAIFSLGEIYDAFRAAEAMMLPLQTPLIDIDGDGLPDSLPPKLGGAREIPDKYIVGRGRSEGSSPLEIEQAAALPEVLSGGGTTATMTAGPIIDDNGSGISNVWGVIITPIEQYLPKNNSVLVVPEQKLQDRDGDGIYEESYEKFTISGDYPIYIYAVDRSDNLSLSKTTVVKQTAGLTIEKGDLDIDGDIDLTDVLIALKIAAGLKPPRAFTAFEVNGDEKIGMIEAIYGLMKVAELQ